MAVESLLLSDESTVSEARKDAEWVGENAAPAFIVCPFLRLGWLSTDKIDWVSYVSRTRG